jgi:glycosyltransferase involved in cell wall biosynthesis
MPEADAPCRVLHVITDLSSGGAQRMLSRLVTAAPGDGGAGFSHTVVSLTDRGVYGDQLAGAGVPVIPLGVRGLASLPAGLLRLTRLIRQARPDVVQTWLYHGDFLGLLAAGLARRRAAVVWNVRCSDMELARYAWTTRALVRVLARLSHRPDAVIVNSQAGRDVHAALGYRPKAWHVLPNGFRTAALRPEPAVRAATRARLGLEAGDVAFVCAARVDPMKDHATLLEAFARLRQDRPAAKLMLLGAGTDEAAGPLARLRTDPGLAGAVIPLGERTHDYNDLLQGADSLVLASAFGEGFPNVLGEAMCLAIPCITTDVGDSARVVDETGWVVPRRDPAALARAMAALCELSPEARAELGAAARARAAERFSLEAVLADYAALYRRLSVASGGGASPRPSSRR